MKVKNSDNRFNSENNLDNYVHKYNTRSKSKINCNKTRNKVEFDLNNEEYYSNNRMSYKYS